MTIRSGRVWAAGVLAAVWMMLLAASASHAQTFKVLVNFNGDNGGSPYDIMNLIQGTDGNLYGTTSGTEYSSGTVFKVTPAGALTTLDVLTEPYAGLVLGTDENFYGTTACCGAYGHGTVFRLSRAGVLTVIYNFCAQTNCPDGGAPYAGLVQGTDGSFYGSTTNGGAYDGGTIFKITSSGVLKTLYSFNYTSGPTGAQPWAPTGASTAQLPTVATGGAVAV